MSKIALQAIRKSAIPPLNTEKLAVQDLFLLLVNNRDKEIQQTVLAHLKGHVEDAPSIIAMGLNQKRSWEDFEYIGEENKASFICWAVIRISGQPYTTIHLAQGNRKQR